MFFASDLTQVGRMLASVDEKVEFRRIIETGVVILDECAELKEVVE